MFDDVKLLGEGVQTATDKDRGFIHLISINQTKTAIPKIIQIIQKGRYC